MIKKFGDIPVENWLHECPVLSEVMRMEPTFWQNRQLKPFKAVTHELACTAEDVLDAADRLKRFAPYIAQTFPETAAQDGIIESPLQAIPEMHDSIEKRYAITIPGSLFIKLDSHLPISGSIKARGGIYEVLKFAEDIAVDKGLLSPADNYTILNNEPFRKLFSDYSIAVGSTGNLGLSIGIISAKLGFQVTVHMSADAKLWKKDLLRSQGVTVIEHNADYGFAVAEGRKQAESNPLCHFVDDEDSRDLFLGYAVAAERLKSQLYDQQIVVDENHPLVVYIPCGVGGGPGGITFGLKLAFGDNVHCFFCEPTSSPAILTGLATGFHEHISAADLGLVDSTIADGLAVSRPSGLVCRMMQNILAGVFTVADREMYELLTILHLSEKINLEPSAVVGFSGFARFANLAGRIQVPEKNLPDITHLIWATGGSMVPENVWDEYFKQGLKLLISENKHIL